MPLQEAKVKSAMREILIGLARQRQTITYGELATLLGLHHRSRVFHRWLREVCRAEHDAGHRQLCALVVRHDTRIPGSGYFGFAAAVAWREQAGADGLQALWEADRDAVFDYWANVPGE